VRECWAKPLGDCKGGITGEHLFTRSIFTGEEIVVDGAPWFKGVSKRISLDAAVGNILCEHHNHTLGTYADPAGKELREAMQASVRNKPEATGTATEYVRSPGGIIVPKPTVTIRGPHVGAWLAKTHCNMIANTKGTPSIEYIQYAFSPRNPQIQFYYPHVLGEDVGFTDQPHATYVNFHEPGEPFAIQICGFWSLVALQPIPKLEVLNFLDRVREVRFQTLTLALDWTDDPPRPSSPTVQRPPTQQS